MHVFISFKWVASCENALERAQNAQIQIILRMRKYHPGLCSHFIHSVVFNDSVSGQRRPRSDCTDAQSDLGLRCPHMRGNILSQGLLHILCIVFVLNAVSSKFFINAV